jgi:hydrogenase nickel incorporation protein HypA/HybF
MHEYSLAQSLVERVVSEASEHGATGVRRISLKVGELSGVEPDLLMTAFDFVREGTLCSSSELQLEYVQCEWYCTSCGKRLESDVPKMAMPCADCGGLPRLAAGEELHLMSVELEVPNV